MRDEWRQTSEKEIVTELQKKEQYEATTKPIFTTDAGYVSLTLDDGPSTHTERILDVLAEKNVKAIFFMLGENVEKHRQVARKVVESGHLIGNHSYSHPFFTKISEAQQVSELTKASQIIADATGVGPRYFRPPYGAFTETTLGLVIKQQMQTVMWSADPRDYSFNTATAVYKATDPIIASRKILLLHDLKEATVVALPRIIDDIRAKNLSVTDQFETSRYRKRNP